jgi:C4-dicarboxylate-specific signal transduction histidine kinase
MELKEREEVDTKLKVSTLFYAFSFVVLLSSFIVWYFYENSSLSLTIFIFSLVMVLFTYMDKQREEQKNVIIKKLQKSNIILQSTAVELEIKSQKISKLNSSLESRVQEELAKNRAKDMQLIEQTRLAQMGEMMSMIAHQWRQPLASISAASNALILKAELKKLTDDLVIEQCSKVVKQSQDLSDTINNFKNFFKQESQTQESNFEELIEVALGIIGKSLEDKSILVVKKIEKVENFMSYQNELKQVILSLIKNAEDMLVEKNVENPFIRLTVYSEDGCSVLKVNDNAGGISEDIMKNIFDPYFSTKSEKTGRGLGLYMSKMIIEEHCQGLLSVKNSKEGAEFKITIKTKKYI